MPLLSRSSLNPLLPKPSIAGKLLLFLLAILSPFPGWAEEAASPQTVEEILHRLDRQNQEIQELRDRLSLYENTTGTSLLDPLPEPEGSPSELDEILDRLDEIEKNLSQSAETRKKEAAAAEEKKKKEWTVKLGGHVQMDFIHWTHTDDPPIPAEDYFEFRRLRLMADGKGYEWLDFRLQMDIEPESGDGVTTPVVDVKDAYLTANEVPLFQRVRIGNFFVPYSLEQVTNDTNNIFMERSIPTQGVFSADREVGIAFYGVNETQDFTWTGGMFIDSISESRKERIDDNQGYRLSGRLTWLPYFDEASHGRYLFHIGTGILYTADQDDLMRYRARPQIHEGPFLIDSGNIAASSSTSANLELATVLGPVSFQSELFATTVDRLTADPANLYGAYLYGSWFLTGENRIYDRYGQHGAQFSRNVPYRNFHLKPGNFGPGAWELKARGSWLDLAGVDAGQYRDVTLGINWYWNDRTRIMFDFIHPMTTEDSLPYGGTAANLTALRFDFNW